MVYSRFTTSIIVQCVLIAVTPVLFIWALSKEYMLVTSVALIIVWFAQIAGLIHYVKVTNRYLNRFFDSFKYNDGTLHFNKRKSDVVFKELLTRFNEIIDAFNFAKIDKAKEHLFFMNLIEHVNVGLLAYDEKGNVQLYNKTFTQLLNIQIINAIGSLNHIYGNFTHFLANLKAGQGELLKLNLKNKTLHLLVKMSKIKMDGKTIKLISFQNIKTEIDKSETEAWQKLIKVLSHEIMNSISPVRLLSGNLIKMFETDGNSHKSNQLSDEIINNTLLGLKAIEKRSVGLTRFMELYKNLTSVPELKRSKFRVKPMIDRIETIFKEESKLKNIELEVKTVPLLIELFADEEQIEETLINLLKNAIYAIRNMEKPKVRIVAVKEESGVYIKIVDNGEGICEENLENIFVPFFTTKENGSGIGLSMAAKIMRMHNGDILVQSIPDKETVFTLKFEQEES